MHSLLTPVRACAHRFRSVLVLALGVGTVVAPSQAAPRNPAGFEIERGVNLSHWLSQDFGWAPREAWITENDFEYIAHLGFDHVRLPIDEKEMWDESGERIPEAFALMREALGWAEKNNLRVVLDLHTVRTHHFNAVNEGGLNTLFTDPAAKKAFVELWRDLSDAVGDVPVDQLAYEIMNEPVADDPADWNALIAMTAEAIRELEPDRVLVIGSNLWQLPQTFPYLEVPEGDRNIILSTHTYAPFPFTHYTASWTPLRDYAGPVQYPGPVIPAAELEAYLAEAPPQVRELLGSAGDDWGAERLREELAPAIEKAKELDLQLYCGEFGALATVDREDRLAYYRDIVRVFEEAGIAYANWEYKGDFGIFEWHGPDHLIGAPDLPLIRILSGN
ncbi:MAG: glycoside hydrolase family 5 protein [Opitutales bacterium]